MRKVILLIAAVVMLVGGSVRADVVTEWNLAVQEYLTSQGIGNHLANRTMAMVHLAMFDAANAGIRTYEPFLYHRRMGQSIPQDVAAATAAFEVLRGLYGDVPEFQALYDQQVEPFGRGLRARRAMLHGQRVAGMMLESRADDGSADAAAVPYPDGTEPGQWRRTGMMGPMMPGWGSVTPFVLTSGAQFRLGGPPPLDSYEYARDYNETKAIGQSASAVRTAEQETIARFWVSGIPTIWNDVAHQLSEARQYDLLTNARLFALLNAALADGQVVSWDMKYHYGFWRPVTAIRLGADDGNDATAPDGVWQALLPNPSFPEYVSGHSTSCSAAATVLALFNGGDAFDFTIASMADPTLEDRSFSGFWSAAREAGISRIYGGIHFNFSNVDGLEAGRSLGRFVFENAMVPRER